MHSSTTPTPHPLAVRTNEPGTNHQEPAPLAPNNPLIQQSINPSLPPPIPLSLQPLPLSALAALLGCTRSTIRHFADRLGFRYTVRRIGPRHKRTACLTPEQAQSIATELEKESAAYRSPSDAESENGASTAADLEAPAASQPRTRNHEPRTSGEGLFYLLQLEPKHDPGRFKLGFSSDLDSRLDDLLTVVPLARLVAAWPAHRSWERIAIISTAQHAEPISQEVFRTENLHEIIAAADRFFAVMPKLEPPPNLPDWLPRTSRMRPTDTAPPCPTNAPAPDAQTPTGIAIIAPSPPDTPPAPPPPAGAWIAASPPHPPPRFESSPPAVLTATPRAPSKERHLTPIESPP